MLLVGGHKSGSDYVEYMVRDFEETQIRKLLGFQRFLCKKSYKDSFLVYNEEAKLKTQSGW